MRSAAGRNGLTSCGGGGKDPDMKKVLFVYGGWEGHTPRESAERFAHLLTNFGYHVALSDSLAAFDEREALREYDLIVPTWTMGELSPERERNLADAVDAGTGLAGWHGTMGDAFRGSTLYQWMVGGQFVAHPGNIQPRYWIEILDAAHPITRGMANFEMRDTEQYYMHVDPSNHVLATTTFASGVVMPAAWTRTWGRGRVAYVSFGHTVRDFDVPQAEEMTLRALRWAAAQPSEG